MELREMTQPEQKYTYRQSHQLDAQTGCIGYLRGDFGSTGKEFYSGWFEMCIRDRINTVLPHDTTYLGLEEGKDLCTLVTCTPFGVNTHRLLIRGHRIAYTPEDEDCLLYTSCAPSDQSTVENRRHRGHKGGQPHQ